MATEPRDGEYRWARVGFTHASGRREVFDGWMPVRVDTRWGELDIAVCGSEESYEVEEWGPVLVPPTDRREG